MRFKATLVAIAAVVGLASAAAADTIKVGVIGTFSGPYALFGRNFKLGIDAYQVLHGKKVGPHDVEFVYKDLDAPNPAKAKALAQELVTKDRVQYLAGIYFTPNAFAVAPILEEAQVPLVILNAATSSIVEKSPYIARTSFTMWQNTVPAARVALKQGSKKVTIAVSDYGPGLDAEAAFRKTFESGGGTVVEAIRMPLGTTDFGPIMQRIKDSGADTVFAFLPSGPPTLGFVKAFIDNGLKSAGVKLLTTGDVVPEPDLPNIGDAAVGILSTYHYASSHDSPENKRFLEAIRKAGGSVDEVTMAAVGAFDGTHLIYKMIEVTDGRRDPRKAIESVKGLSWTSPRGPVSIDPQTRHIRQNVYLRVVDKQNGRLYNKEIEIFPDQPDYGLVPAN